jgi:hypothetical protein
MRIVEANVLPPVLVPKFADNLPASYHTTGGQQMMQQQQHNGSMMYQQHLPQHYQQQQEASMSQNVTYGQSGFSYQGDSVNPVMASNSSPLSPGLSSIGVPSPGNTSPEMPPNALGSPFGGPETPPPAYNVQDEQKFAMDPQHQPPPTMDNAMDVTTGNNNMADNQTPSGSMMGSMDNAEPVAYVEPQFWCSIAYYELNSRVGEVYHAKSNTIQVDGFTNPQMHNNHRFCLGQLSNVTRNSTIESTRRHITKGLSFVCM